MRITLVITVLMLAFLCLALAPYIYARPLQLSFSTDSNPMITKRADETLPTPFGTQAFLNPLASVLDVERRSLKSSSSGSKSKPSKPKKSKKIKWKGGKATLLGSVIGVSVFLGVFLLCAVFIIVTEKREEDPNWRVRTFLRRKFKRKYTIKAGKGDIDDMEKPHVEKELPEAGGLDTDPTKKVNPEDAPVKKVEPADVK